MTIEQQTFDALPPYPEAIRADFLRTVLPFEWLCVQQALMRLLRDGRAERCGRQQYRRKPDAPPPDDGRGGRRPGAGRKRKP